MSLPTVAQQYQALSPYIERLSEATGREVLSGRLYVEALHDLEEYKHKFWLGSGKKQAFKWLARLPKVRRQNLYDLYTVVKDYIRDEIYNIVAANGDEIAISNDVVENAANILALKWPNSYLSVHSNTFDPTFWARELHTHLEVPEDTEAKISDAQADLKSKLETINLLQDGLRYGHNINVRQLIDLQSDVIRTLLEDVNINN